MDSNNQSLKVKKRPSALQVNTISTRFNPVLDAQSPSSKSAVSLFNSQMLTKYGHLKMHLINSQLKNHSQIEKIKELIEKPEIIALVKKFELHQLKKRIPGHGNYQYEGFSNVQNAKEFKPNMTKLKSGKEKINKNVAVAKLLANILNNKVKESYYRPFMRALPTLKQDIQIYKANKQLAIDQAKRLSGLKYSVQTDFGQRPIDQEKTRASTIDQQKASVISNFTTQQKHMPDDDQFDDQIRQQQLYKGLKKLKKTMQKQINKKYLDFVIDLQVMSSDNKRPPIVRKGKHTKSPSMTMNKRNRLDIGMNDLDISVIECSDDKEYIINNKLNLSDDNIMKSISHIRTFEKSSTCPLKFKDEENKEGEEEQNESNFSCITESVDQEEEEMKKDQQQLKFEIDGFKDELDEFDKFIQEHLNDTNMLKELQLHQNGSDEADEEMKLDNTDDLINFGFKDLEDFQPQEIDELQIQISQKKKENKKKQGDSFELQLGSDDDRMNDFD